MTELKSIISDILRNEELDYTGRIHAILEVMKEDAPKKPKKPKHWPGMYRPEIWGEYFHAFDGCGCYTHRNQPITNKHRAQGFCCETAKEAEFVKAHMEARLEVIDRLAKLNEGWRPDWSDHLLNKWEIWYDHRNQDIEIKSHEMVQYLSDCFQAKSIEIWKQVIDELGEKKVKLAIWPKYEEE